LIGPYFKKNFASGMKMKLKAALPWIAKVGGSSTQMTR
jgi:hypothetical protein